MTESGSTRGTVLKVCVQRTQLEADEEVKALRFLFREAPFTPCFWVGPQFNCPSFGFAVYCGSDHDSPDTLSDALIEYLSKRQRTQELQALER